VVVPINPALSGRELAHVVADVRPALAVAGGGPAARLASLERPVRAVVGAAALDGDAASTPVDLVGPGDPALVVYTSGTTGDPKGAVLTHGNLLAGTATLRLAWRWEPADRLVLALPLFHVHGLVAGLLGSLSAGASATVLERFSPEGVLDAVAGGATLFFGVPTMYHRLVGSGRAAELGRLRLCVSGSAPLPADLWRRAGSSGVQVLERYGMTETLLTVSNPYDGERRPGTVGFPLPGAEVRLDHEEPRAGTGDGAAGVLLVRGPTVFDGYWERPAATAEACTDGWFRTGDLASVDADGYLVLRGRRHDLIISGGFNVYPAEVEDVLLAHPSVAEAAVTGTPSEEWGEAVTAWVVPADGVLDVEALEAYAAQRLSPYKRPRLVRVVDALPRNAMGKVLRHELR
jgi:acyl-CoA synthetase (AMP-forming)/AMP-acid ligase II